MSGNIRSEETCAKIRQNSVGFVNRLHIQESKDKISKSCSGRKDSDESKKKKSITKSGSKNAKLTEAQVIEIYYSTESNSVLFGKYSISMERIWGITKKVYWKSITKDFSILSRSICK